MNEWRERGWMNEENMDEWMRGTLMNEWREYGWMNEGDMDV